MRTETVKGIPLVRFETLSLPEVVHAVTTRAGGVSAPPFDTLNLALRTGDDRERVLVNRQRVAAALGAALQTWVCANQVHGERVAVVGWSEAGRGALRYETAIPETDALTTAEPGLILATLGADCPLVGLVDPGVPAVGLAHASWRSTVAGIVGRTVAQMVAAFGCRPARMRAAIAPSAGPCCYEVGEEVRVAARKALAGADRFFVLSHGRLHFDLWSANVAQLTEAGVPRESVEVAGCCSICHADQFFSYRAARGPIGHGAFLLGLRGE